jgi:sortase B
MGWIFMDYRNNPTNLDKNTIIYGHNVRSGIMFGTLKNTLSSSWYKNENNHIISFNTANESTTWKVFSIYRTSPTNDYLQNTFNSDTEYMEFINMIKSRSVYNFNVDVKPEDKIITLSSCYGNSDRVVLHAVQIKE